MGCLSRAARLTVVAAMGGAALASVAAAQTATVSTMAELRTAVGNSSITTININPGTYLLTSSGSGQLQIERNLTLTNTGGGRVVIDANNASRVFYINGATVTMTGLTITRGNGNTGSEGGGVYANSATLRLIRSTLSGSVTSGSKAGGGVWSNSSTLELINSTVSANTATGAQGGGVYANGGSVLVSNSTVAGNSASSGGGIYRSASLTLRNSIVADNTGGQIAGSGTITSNGKNVVEGGCTGCSASDLTADPNLGALANNGGDSYTHALLSGSPALNSASNTDAQATDQRGRARPQGTTADMGAFEAATDLAVTKGVSNATPAEGAAISYTVTVSGAGADGATSVTVSDVLPAGVTYQSSSASQGSYASGTGIWTVGTVASGDTATLTLSVTVNSGTSGSTITNTASLASLTEAEWSTANNTASTAITVQAGVSVVVTPDGGQNLERLPSNGVSYTFTFTVQNTGGAAGSFDVLASTPGSLVITIVSVDGVGGDSTRLVSLGAGASQAVAVVYTVADVAAGARDTLQLRGRSVSQPAVLDDGSADVTVVKANLTISKQAFRDDQTTPVGAGNVAPGEYVQYRVTVTNSGTASASNVHVDDLVPAQETFVSAAGDAAGWTFVNTGNDVDADLSASLAVGASRFFWVRVRVN